MTDGIAWPDESHLTVTKSGFTSEWLDGQVIGHNWESTTAVTGEVTAVAIKGGGRIWQICLVTTDRFRLSVNQLPLLCQTAQA